MKGKIAPKCFLVFLAGFLLTAASASAQSVAYRQTNLASDVAGFGANTDPFLQNPWGIAVVPGQSFSIANANHGRVISLDATGSRIGPADFTTPNPAGTGPAIPVGIIDDPNSFFGGRNLIRPLIMATQDGGIYTWGVDAIGNVPPQATLVVDHPQSGAVYTALAILAPQCCAPFLAVANFHSGLVEPYTAAFVPLAPPGSFTDPNLPAGYAPYGMQVVASQIFITYALQDAAKQNPVIGAGNGIVSVFDLEGNFVRRFATAGTLNAPWGIAQASANFGPFSNDILIGNVGDGTISAFDPVTGSFTGQIKDGDGNLIVNTGLHALTFRSDGFGDPNTLYFTAGIGNGQDGLFGAIAAALVSTTRVSVPPILAGTAATITVTVSAGPGNLGTPKGDVTLQDGGVLISDVPLTNGVAQFNTVLRGVGVHVIEAQYSGDDTFLPSSSQTDVQVTGPATILELTGPATAAPGAPVQLVATITSSGGIPTGQIVFHDGATGLGTARLNATGVATLTINNLAVRAHSITADYAGDGTFAGSTSNALTITIAGADFSLGAAPMSATVVAGQSAQFMLTVTPSGGFANNVAFSCSPVAGIGCAFSPATVTPASGAATTTLIVTTSAGVMRYGLLPYTVVGPAALLAALVLLGFLLCGTLGNVRASLLAATAVLAVALLSLSLGGCGGYASQTQTNRGTASITITAQSGTISHTSTISVTVQ